MCPLLHVRKGKSNVPRSGGMYHLFDVRCHMTGVIRQESGRCHLSRTGVMCKMFAVICHKSIVRKGQERATYCLLVRYNLSLERCHVSHVKCQLSTVRCQMSDVTCQVSDVRFHVSPVLCQKSQQQEPAPPPIQVLC